MDLIIIGVIAIALIILIAKSKKQPSTPLPLPQPAPAITKSIRLTPIIPSPIKTYTTDVVDNIYETIPMNNWGLSIRHMGKDAVKFHPTDVFTDITGLDAPCTNQLGNNPNKPSIVFQTLPDEWSSFIDTSLTPPRKITGGGQHSIMEFMFDKNVKPYTNKDDILNISSEVAVPYQVLKNNGIAQLSFVSYFSDKNGNKFAIVVALHDNRYRSYAPSIMNDTFTAFVSTPIETNKYITRLSGFMTNRSYKDYRLYEYNITYDNFTNIITALNAYVRPQIGWKGSNFDTDVLSYEITQVGILHEVFVESDPNNVVACAIRGRKLAVNRLTI